MAKLPSGMGKSRVTVSAKQAPNGEPVRGCRPKRLEGPKSAQAGPQFGASLGAR